MATIDTPMVQNIPSAGRFYGHRDAVVLYRVYRLMEEARGCHKSH